MFGEGLCVRALVLNTTYLEQHAYAPVRLPGNCSYDSTARRRDGSNDDKKDRSDQAYKNSNKNYGPTLGNPHFVAPSSAEAA